MICKICNWRRKADANACLMHRRTCDGFGDDDYSSIYNIPGFGYLSCIIEHIRGTQIALPSTPDNETLHTDDASDTAAVPEEIEPLDIVEIEIGIPAIVDQTNSFSGLSVDISTTVYQGQQVSNEPEQHLHPVDLITVHTRAAEIIGICFVCRESSNRSHYSLITSRTKYTRQQLIHVLELFLDLESNKINDSDKICSKCLKLINRYDLAAEKANKIKVLIEQRITGEIDLGTDENTNNLEADNTVHYIDVSDDEIDNGNEEDNVIDLVDDDDDSVDIVVG